MIINPSGFPISYKIKGINGTEAPRFFIFDDKLLTLTSKLTLD
jgi:hypothetical protein